MQFWEFGIELKILSKIKSPLTPNVRISVESERKWQDLNIEFYQKPDHDFVKSPKSLLGYVLPINFWFLWLMESIEVIFRNIVRNIMIFDVTASETFSCLFSFLPLFLPIQNLTFQPLSSRHVRISNFSPDLEDYNFTLHNISYGRLYFKKIC